MIRSADFLESHPAFSLELSQSNNKAKSNYEKNCVSRGSQLAIASSAQAATIAYGDLK